MNHTNMEILKFLPHLVSIARNEGQQLFKEKLFGCTELSIGTLMDEMQPVGSEKCKFQFQENSILSAIFGSFGLLGFRCQEFNRRFCY